MIRLKTARLAAGIALAVAAATAPLAALSGPASASATPVPGPNAPEQVSSGINVSSLPGATAFGNTPPDTPETVSFILKERNLTQLESQAQRGFSTYLTVSQFASTHGQTPANIAALTSYLTGYGITTTVYADGVDVNATGTAGEFDQALSVSQKQYDVPAQVGRGGLSKIPAQDNVHGNVQAPVLPFRLANFVLAILGLSDYGPYVSQSVHVNHSYFKPKPQDGGCLKLTGLTRDCQLPSDFAANYGLDGLYDKGANGSGQTLAIVTLAAVDPGAPQHFWSKIADVPVTGRTFTVRNIDGGPGAPSDSSGSGETDLDIEQSGALAPGANVIDYQAPNTDYGFADGFFTAASQDTASTVSSSWGESETVLQASILAGQEASAYVAAFDEAFLELAAQGQSGFIASGDSGAYEASNDIGTTDLSVQSNSDSPYITAAGGTTLPFSGTLTGPDGGANVAVSAQRIWGWDYLWSAIAQIYDVPEAEAAESTIGGSGGGFSRLEPSPVYQSLVRGTHSFSAVPYLTPTDYQTIVPGLIEPTQWTFNPAPAVTTGQGHFRAVPDLAADADPNTGYALYAPSMEPALQYGWGGTSFVAPQLNGAAAVIDSYLGHRVGFWNPAIYAAALLGGSSDPFTPLNTQGTSNDNLYYTGTPGQPFNEGAGLGIPNLTTLASDFH